MPITTGRRYVDWLKSYPGVPDLSRSDIHAAYERVVLAPNLEDARSLVQVLRHQLDPPLIDPSVFPNVEGWSQSDYIELWSRVIDRYAARVIFTPGWQYSRGCVCELRVAVEARRTILDEELLPLTPRRAFDLIGQAVAELRALGLETPHADLALKALSPLCRLDSEVR
jgi:hypothetical protein